MKLIFFENKNGYKKIKQNLPFQANWIDFKQRYRNQIPLDLAFAITIHKSQGLTLERAVINLGKSENQSGGITFVALSHLKTFEGLWLKPMPWP